MLMEEYAYMNNYTAVGDLIVVAICIVMAILVATSYLSRTKNFLFFINMIAYLVLSALCNVYTHMRYSRITDGNYISIGILRVVFHALIFSLFFIFVVYIVSMLKHPGITLLHSNPYDMRMKLPDPGMVFTCEEDEERYIGIKVSYI